MRWRFDKQCGPGYPLPDGSPSECDPDGDAPCCYGWTCRSTKTSCTCVGCIDYRKVRAWRAAGNTIILIHDCCKIRVVLHDFVYCF